MKRLLSFLLLSCLLLTACSQKTDVPTWQQQYDLGVRYLSEGNYEEAIIAFTAAIEIEPMRAEAYLDLAYAYIGQNDFDSAREVLEKGYELTQEESLREKLDELDGGDVIDYMGNLRRLIFYDGFGNLAGYQIFDYDSPYRESSVTSFDAAGNQNGYVELVYDGEGSLLVSYSYDPETGELTGRVEYEYDGSYNIVREEWFDLDTGESQGYWLSQYDDQGNRVRDESYHEDGEMDSYSLYVYEEYSTRKEIYDTDGTLCECQYWNYDENGQVIEYGAYGADGALLWHDIYHYDDEGNEIGCDSYDGEGNLVSSAVYD